MRIIVLFNLKPGVGAADYEDWARTRDLPGVRALPSVDDFQVLRATGLLGSNAVPAYGYIGIIDVADMDGYAIDIASEAIKTLETEFKAFADGQQFILTEALGRI